MDIKPLTTTPTHLQDAHTNSGKDIKKTSENIDVKNIKNTTETMVLEQLININIGHLSKSQELTFRKVVEKLDAILAPTQGENSTKKAMDAGTDFSPKATAQSITSYASGIIARFQSENHLEKGDPKLAKFVDLIQNSIQQGFQESKDILGKLEVFKGQVEKTFDATLTETLKNMAQIRVALGLEPTTNNAKASEVK